MKMLSCLPSRRSFLALLSITLCGMTAAVRADDKGGFKESAFFKSYLGDWEMEGELKKADGEVIKIKETWKAEILGEDTLSVTGTRELNDNTQSFTWTFTHNPATGLYEASHKYGGDSPDAQHFEVSLSETDMKMDMTALVGTNNSKIAISESYPDKEHDMIESKITFTDETGNTSLSGTLLHKRVKKP